MNGPEHRPFAIAMVLLTNAIGGLSCDLYTTPDPFPGRLLTILALTPAALLGAAIPDLDLHRVRFLPRRLQHRGVTHSLIGAILGCLPFFYLTASLGMPSEASAIFLAWLSHLALDAVSCGPSGRSRGISLTWPFYHERVQLVPKACLIRPRHHATVRTIAFIVSIAAVVWTVQLGPNGPIL